MSKSVETIEKKIHKIISRILRPKNMYFILFKYFFQVLFILFGVIFNDCRKLTINKKNSNLIQ